MDFAAAATGRAGGTENVLVRGAFDLPADAALARRRRGERLLGHGKTKLRLQEDAAQREARVVFSAGPARPQHESARLRLDVAAWGRNSCVGVAATCHGLALSATRIAGQLSGLLRPRNDQKVTRRGAPAGDVSNDSTRERYAGPAVPPRGDRPVVAGR